MSIETRKNAAGATYYLVRIKSGRVFVGSKAFSLKRDAEAWERDQLHRLETGRPLPPKKSFTLSQLVDMFIESRSRGNAHTLNTDANNLNALSKHILARPLASIHSSDLREHLLAQLRRGKAPSTVARAKTTLSALFTYADEQGLLHQPHPVRTMKKIPELSTVAQHAVSPKDVPDADRLAEQLSRVRTRRPDVADVFEFMSLTGIRWGEARALRADSFSRRPLPQLIVERSHSDNYDEKDPKSWRGERAVPLSPRALEIFTKYAKDRQPGDYLFKNQHGRQLSVGTVRKFPLGFTRHALRHFAASTWLRLGTPVHEVAEYLGDEPRTVLAVYAHILGERQRRDHATRLANAEAADTTGATWGQPGRNLDPVFGPTEQG